ncbi:MAG: DUF4286 family protein [Flavobacteriales bacterium]
MKLIYNVTVNISDTKHEEWVLWMLETHIPDVMKTGKFLDYRFCEVVSDDPEGTTYSIQYSCENRAILDEYLMNHSPELQKEHKEKFEGHYVAFRTLLKWLN